ncbi:MAG: sulfite exporter TauE/SafE family protein [Sedimentisphaerales bacterium]|nr:sulfite exporter TauE/SafE family protein [Sedimentisphaerales bacterium]
MQLTAIAILTIVASAVGTMTGFGTSTIMVPALLLFYPAPETILLVGIIHWFGNLWKILLFRGGFRLNLVLCFGIPGILASYLGASLMPEVSEKLLSRILGGFMIVYVVFLLSKSSFKLKQNIPASAFGGALSGFLAGIFGIGGAVRGMFLTAFNLPKAVYISTAGAIAIFIDTTRMGKYLADGIRLDSFSLWSVPLFILASFLGARIAKHIVDKVPQKHFRTVVCVFLFLVAVKLLLWPTR